MRQVIKLAGGVIAEKYNIIGTSTEVAKVWEPKEGHSTITTFDGTWYGQIGTERLPAELEKLPCGNERYAAVKSWQAGKYARAYALILQAFPEMTCGRYDMGDITIW